MGSGNARIPGSRRFGTHNGDQKGLCPIDSNGKGTDRAVHPLHRVLARQVGRQSRAMLEKFEKVVFGAAEQLFPVHLRQSPEQEAPEAQSLLDLAEDWFHGGLKAMRQTVGRIHSNMQFHAARPPVALPGRVRLRIPRLPLVLGGGGRIQNGNVDDCALRQNPARFCQMAIQLGKEDNPHGMAGQSCLLHKESLRLCVT